MASLKDKYNPENYPPCIKRIMKSIYMCSDDELSLLIFFLRRMGWHHDEIASIVKDDNRLELIEKETRHNSDTCNVFKLRSMCYQSKGCADVKSPMDFMKKFQETGEETSTQESTYMPFTLSDMAMRTDHLKHYDELSTIVSLGGNEYIPLKKALWYHIVGGTLKIPIQIGDVITDTRVPLSIPIAAGRGKKSFIEAVKFSAKATGRTFMAPVSLHPEQLVGKTKISKKGEIKQIYGAFKSDFIAFDEASDLVQARNDIYRQSLSYIRVALDPIGNNTVVKKMVDVENTDALQYNPECSILMCFQPIPINEYFVSSGTFRRFRTPFLKLDVVPQSKINEIISNQLDGRDVTEEAKKGWRKFLNEIKECKGTFRITPDGKEMLLKSNEELAMLMFTWSKKASDYATMIQFAMNRDILKMAAIHAAIENRFDINAYDIMKAHMDLFEVVCLEMSFLDAKILGELDYGESWGGAMGEDKECLQWLVENGATSKEKTTITIAKYISHISETYGISEKGSIKRYNNHREKGWVIGLRVGEHSSVVWTKIGRQVPQVPKFPLQCHKNFLTSTSYPLYHTYNYASKFNFDGVVGVVAYSSSGLTVTSYPSIVNKVSLEVDKNRESVGVVGVVGVLASIEKKDSNNFKHSPPIEKKDSNDFKHPDYFISVEEKLQKWKNSGRGPFHGDFLVSMFKFDDAEIEKLKSDGMIHEVTPNSWELV